MTNSSAVSRQQSAYRWIERVVLTAGYLLNVALLFKLGALQLDGVPTALAASLGIAIAFTSLMYNRARAASGRRVRFESLLAAELGLRSVLMASVGVAIVVVTFPYLLAIYPSQPGQLVPTRLLPTAGGAVVGLVMSLAFWLLMRAIRVLLRPRRGSLFTTALKVRRMVGR